MVTIKGVTEAEIDEAITTASLSTAEKGATVATTSFGTALKGLWTTLMANPLILVGAAITALASAYFKVKQAQEEALSKAKEAATTYSDQAASIDDAVEKYKELHSQLIKAKGNEEETANIKSQLLDLQKQLNEQFGEEYGKLNLVTDAYKDQTNAIKEYNKEAANNFLNENKSQLDDAQSAMEKERTFIVADNFSQTYSDLKASGSDYAKYYEQINKLANQNNISFDEFGNLSYTGNAQEAENAINAFMSSLRNLQDQLGNTDENITSIFDTIFSRSEKSLNEAKKVTDEWGDLYQQKQLAEIASDNSKSDKYNSLVNATQSYNNAVANSDNPYEDDAVKSAYNNLLAIKQEISDDSSWNAYRSIIDKTFDEADTKSYEFYNAIKNNENGIKDLTDQLQGKSATDITSMIDDGNNGDAFDKLQEKMSSFGLSSDEIISVLKQLGIVIDDTASSAQNSIPSLTSFEEAWINLKNTDDDDLKKEADNLLDLAEAGQLTANALEELAGGKELMNNTGLSADELAKKINNLVDASTQLNAMSGQISKMSDMLADKNNGKTADASDLAGFDASVKGLDSWEQFEKVMGDSKSSMKDCQEAANALATEWVTNGEFLDNLTESNKGYYESQLKAMGVENAQEIVEKELEGQKLALKISTDGLTKATLSEIQAYMDEKGYSEDAQKSLYQLLLTKLDLSKNPINTASDIEQLIALANAAGTATQYVEALQRVLNMMNGINTYTNAHSDTNDAKQQQLDERGFSKSKAKTTDEYAIEQANKYAKLIQNAAKNTKLDANDFKISSSGSGGYKTPSGSKSKSKGSSSTKNSKQEIDWIERKITVLNNKIDKFSIKSSDTWSSWTSRSKALNNEISTTQKLLTSVYGVSDKLQKKYDNQKTKAKNTLDNYIKKNSKLLTDANIKKIDAGKFDTSKLSKKQKQVIAEYQKLQANYDKAVAKANQNPAAEKYYSKANAVAKKYKLSSATIKKIKNGTIDIRDYNEKMAEGIQKYQDYYDKGKDAEKSKLEAQQKIKDLVEEQISQIQSKYDAQLSKVDHESNVAQSKLDYAEATGHYATQKYYNQMISSENDSIKLNQQEADDLIKKRDQLVKDGTLKKGSEEWYNMSQQIWQCKENVLELKNNIVDYNNSLRDLAWDAFDRQEEYIQRVIDEANFLIDIMDSKQKFDENGNITSYGKSAEGLHAVNANVYQQLAKDASDEIARLDKEYANDKYNKDYLERRQTLVESQRESIKNYQSERQAIVSLVSEGYNAMSDALDKLIEKRKNALSAEKSLYEYQKSIASKTKNIASLQKQLDAFSNDASEETKAKIQKLKVSLDDAKTDLRDSEYDQWVSDQEELMDKVSEDFKDWIDTRLKDTDAIIKDVVAQTNSSASEIKNTLTQTAEENGTKLTSEMDKIWSMSSDTKVVVDDIKSALGGDGVLNSSLTTISSVLNEIKDYVKTINTNPVTTENTDNSGNDNKGNSSSGNSGSGSGNKNNNTTKPTTTKPTTSSSSSTKLTNAQWAAKYLTKKKFTGNKSALNKNSLVDRLKYFDFDSSMSARTKFYKTLFGGAYSGSAAQNTKLIAEMKKHGFRNGGEIGKLIKRTGEDGFVLARAGEGIMSKENMEKLREAVTLSNASLNMYDKLSKFPQIPTNNNMNDIQQNVSIGDIYMEGVNDPEQFAKELRNAFTTDTKTQKMVSTFIGNQLLGKNSLEFKKYR